MKMPIYTCFPSHPLMLFRFGRAIVLQQHTCADLVGTNPQVEDMQLCFIDKDTRSKRIEARGLTAGQVKKFSCVTIGTLSELKLCHHPPPPSIPERVAPGRGTARRPAAPAPRLSTQGPQGLKGDSPPMACPAVIACYRKVSREFIKALFEAVGLFRLL